MKNTICLIIALVILSCNKPDEWITSTIEAGEHRSKSTKAIPAKAKQALEVVFDGSNITDTTYNAISKIKGVSDGINHMKHSARIGYRYLAEQMIIGIYSFPHIDGQFYFNPDMEVRSPVLLGTVEIGRPVSIGWWVTKDEYRFYCQDAKHVYKRSKGNRLGVSYPLNFYFGGRDPAPHRMQIRYRIVQPWF